MSDEERQQLRDLQDRWLILPSVVAQIRDYGEGHFIAGLGSPSFRRVRTELLPEWRGWFEAFFQEEK